MPQLSGNEPILGLNSDYKINRKKEEASFEEIISKNGFKKT
jgi:hypothetical protein